MEAEVGVRGRRVRGERPDHSGLHREHPGGFRQHANGHGFVEGDLQVHNYRISNNDVTLTFFNNFMLN